MTTFWWDFFGRDARPKAMHFLNHLQQTLAVWNVDGQTGIRHLEGGACSAFAKLPIDRVEELRESLRPNRITTED